MSGSPATIIEPPVNHPAIGDDGLQSKPWLDHAQEMADRVSLLQARRGVVDGSDAAAGEVGEYLSASFGSVSLANGVAANVGTLSLTAGDWDVHGSVNVVSSAGTMTTASASAGVVSATLTDPGRAGVTPHPTSTLNAVSLTVGPVRININAPAPAYLVGFAGFTSGTVSAQAGFIGARRVR